MCIMSTYSPKPPQPLWIIYIILIIYLDYCNLIYIHLLYISGVCCTVYINIPVSVTWSHTTETKWKQYRGCLSPAFKGAQAHHYIHRFLYPTSRSVRPCPYWYCWTSASRKKWYTHLLSCLDFFMCWLEVIPLVDTSTDTVVYAFLMGWIYI